MGQGCLEQAGLAPCRLNNGEQPATRGKEERIASVKGPIISLLLSLLVIMAVLPLLPTLPLGGGKANINRGVCTSLIVVPAMELPSKVRQDQGHISDMVCLPGVVLSRFSQEGAHRAPVPSRLKLQTDTDCCRHLRMMTEPQGIILLHCSPSCV